MGTLEELPELPTEIQQRHVRERYTKAVAVPFYHFTIIALDLAYVDKRFQVGDPPRRSLQRVLIVEPRAPDQLKYGRGGFFEATPAREGAKWQVRLLSIPWFSAHLNPINDHLEVIGDYTIFDFEAEVL